MTPRESRRRKPQNRLQRPHWSHRSPAETSVNPAPSHRAHPGSPNGIGYAAVVIGKFRADTFPIAMNPTPQPTPGRFSRERSVAIRASGFTLIELLTVIAIIGILAAIIIPTVGKVRIAAKGSQCLSNLRQMGMGVNLFAADNRGRLPRVGLNPRPTNPDVKDAMWYSAISPYIQKAQVVSNHPVYRCPSEETPVPPERVNSVIQYSISRAVERSGSAVLPTGTGARTEEIPNPSRTFLLVDVKVNDQGTTSNGSMIYGQILTSISGTPETSTTVSYRHNNGLNCLFADGHTARLSFDEFKTRLIDPIEGRKFWDPFGKF